MYDAWHIWYIFCSFFCFFYFWSFSFSVEICLFIKKALWSSIIYRIIIILLIIVFRNINKCFSNGNIFYAVKFIGIMCLLEKSLFLCIVIFPFSYCICVLVIWCFYVSLNNLWQDSGLISVVKGFRF